eukprot:TRINITY_DN4352_c0_g1_i1.p1 TRINITY_DN4352_c0_g1~~TRINITY_DN4352_c0_g1_i1.p1  ORF type:complete len:1198 (-),score=203.98 TRINITY_DN4352_c0_g1_i1:1530-5069(-)
MASFSFASTAIEDPTTEGTDESDALKAPVHSFVEEAGELCELVSGLASCDIAAAVKRMTAIFEKYQEQPYLLDPHLESVITPLMDHVRRNLACAEVVNPCLGLIYVLSKVRGFKTIVKFLPHEVADLEPLLSVLELCDKRNFETWQSRYGLLLWLSIVVLVPFDLQTIDSAVQQRTGLPAIVERIISLCKTFLSDSGPTRDVAAEALARLLTRPDLVRNALPDFLALAVRVMQGGGDPFMTAGVLSTLVAICSHGARADLLKSVNAIPLTLLHATPSMSTTLRKLLIKLAQRFGLVFLAPRVAKWRYNRGQRSLVANLRQSSTGQAQSAELATHQSGDDDEYDVPEEIEELLQILLDGLADKDTVIRWSAAKGIGRICGRLPSELANELLDSIHDLFDSERDDGAWHGGCLVLAEMARRGLLLPERLATTVPVVIRALRYDVRRGAASVGMHVRDAACYVCWAFARAYAPQEVSPYVESLARQLVIMSVFDREVNCRRAASAAFQENVGRQGTFPHGIEILTVADFFSLGNRVRAYLDIAPTIAQYEEYRLGLIDHLVQFGVPHWDKTVRELSSHALYNLASVASEHIVSNVLPQMSLRVTADDLVERHGAILAVAELTRARPLLSVPFADALIADLINIVPKIESARLYRGRGGEIIRAAVNRLIECIALADLPLKKPQILRLLTTLEDNLKQPNDDVYQGAATSMRTFAARYFERASKEVQEHIMTYISKVASDPIASVRRGYALALGVLPAVFLKSNLEAIIQTLIQATKIEDDPEARDAESRRNAAQSLIAVCECVSVDVGRDVLHRVFAAFLECLKDYSTDNRGDVGSWIREAAMNGLGRLTLLLLHEQIRTPSEAVFTEQMSISLLAHLVQQALEKIDHIRSVAGSVLQRLVLQDPPMLHWPAAVFDTIPRDPAFNWSAESETFPVLVKLLVVDGVRYHALLGLAVSVGGLTESLVRQSKKALIDFIKTSVFDSFDGLLEKIAKDVLLLLRDFSGNDRVIVPLFKMLQPLLTDNVFARLQAPAYDFAPDLLSVVRAEVKGSKDPVKLMAAAGLLCGLLVFDVPTKQSAFSLLSLLLAHRYPKVRKTAAEQLYLAIDAEGVLAEDAVEPVMDILISTRWDGDANAVKGARDEFCKLVGVQPPRPVVAVPPTAGQQPSVAHKAATMGFADDLQRR